jgi:hypothetical protein
MKVDDLAVLREFRKVDTEAADQFLEHVVLVKRSNVSSSEPVLYPAIFYRSHLFQNAMLHNILATRYLDILITQLQNSAISKSFSETRSFYPSPYSHFRTDTSLFIYQSIIVHRTSNFRFIPNLPSALHITFRSKNNPTQTYVLPPRKRSVRSSASSKEIG